MNESKMIELQQQVKLNQMEFGDYMKDLDSWTDEIKKKEEKLVTEKPKENTDLPPVRNSLDKKKKKKKKKVKPEAPKEEPTTTKPKKIRSYDYRSWDKFDVDKALEDVDGQSESSASEYETDEEWEMERKQQQAVVFKDQGNQLFKEGKYTEAVECYTKGIDCDSTNAILPANRAMALLKQEKYAAAELDCSQAIFLDNDYIKAYHRRGTARAALKKYAEAKEDFRAVLDKEKNNKQAKAELEKVERLLNPPEILKSESLETSEEGLVKAIYKHPDMRSKKPLHRMKIEEIGIEEKEFKVPKQSEAKRKIEAKDKAKFDQQFLKTDRPTSSEDPAMNNLRNKITEITNTVTDVSLDNTPTATTNGGQEDLRIDLSEKETETKMESRSKGKSPVVSPQTSPRVPAVPSTSFQFQLDFKALKNTTEQFYQYMKSIDPSQFPSLLGTALESDMLMKMLNTLKDCYVPKNEEVYPVLLGLSGVKRFDMTVMFMSASEKKVVSDLLSYSKSKHATPDAEITILAKKYGV